MTPDDQRHLDMCSLFDASRNGDTKILLDCALTCWEQDRPVPRKLQISPRPAQPRPL